MINLIFLLLLSLPQNSYGFAKAWFSCTQNEECVKVDKGCGRFSSINLKFKDKYEVFLQKTKKSMSCMELAPEALEIENKLVPICSKTQCELSQPM